MTFAVFAVGGAVVAVAATLELVGMPTDAMQDVKILGLLTMVIAAYFRAER